MEVGYPFLFVFGFYQLTIDAIMDSKNYLGNL